MPESGKGWVRNLFALLTAIPPVAFAQQEINLWEGQGAPYSIPHSIEEVWDECWSEPCVKNVHQPTLSVYPAATESKKTLLVLPGGGYDVLAISHEGHEIAEAFAAAGIHAAVLKYRLPDPRTASRPEMVPLTDVRRAIGLLREQASILGVSAEAVGVAGFSAGAHLATVASIHRSDLEMENPDFSVLVYGVTRLTAENLKWLETSLYHRPLTAEEVERETLLDLVTSQTPEAFLVHSLDDTVCDYRESLDYTEALTVAGVDAELHLYAKGEHGFGAGRAEDGTDQWIPLAVDWINRQVISPAADEE